MNEEKTLSIWDARKAFKEYCQILQENERFPPTLADIDHSALLERLLSGKAALPSPPPKRMSYPWYNLGEGQECEVYEMSWYDLPEVCIDQNSQWIKINENTVETLGERYILNMTFDEIFSICQKNYYSMDKEYKKKLTIKKIPGWICSQCYKWHPENEAKSIECYSDSIYPTGRILCVNCKVKNV